MGTKDRDDSSSADELFYHNVKPQKKIKLSEIVVSSSSSESTSTSDGLPKKESKTKRNKKRPIVTSTTAVAPTLSESKRSRVNVLSSDSNIVNVDEEEEIIEINDDNDDGNISSGKGENSPIVGRHISEKYDKLRTQAKAVLDSFCSAVEQKHHVNTEEIVDDYDNDSPQGASAASTKEIITLKAIVQGRKKMIPFKTYKDELMKSLLVALCEKKGLNLATTFFVFDGVKVKDDDTPLSLDLEDDDVLEVHTQI